MSDLPSTTDVLIVGAGPAGMACALSLHAQGYTGFVVVDAVVEGLNSSRALLLHAATLEALDTIGCADELVRSGRASPTIGIWTNGRLIRAAGFDLLAPYTKFPFGLIVPQDMSEAVMGKMLHQNGITVHRPYKVVSVQTSVKDSHMLDVTFENGHVIQARCVVGADGARSVVRKSAGIRFANPHDTSDKPRMLTVLADVTFSTPLSTPPDTAVNLIITRENMFLFTELPRGAYNLPDTRVFRIGANVPPSQGAPPSELSVPYLQSLIDAFGPGRTLPVSADPGVVSPVIEKAVWTSTFRTHSALADAFLARMGNSSESGIVLLVGDAAHIHPPAGGQGMNLGVCDAIALGRVLAETFKASGPEGRVEDGELRRWADARRKRALNVIGIAERVLGLVTTSNATTWVLGCIPINFGRLRDLLLIIIESIAYLRMMFAWQLSGLGANI